MASKISQRTTARAEALGMKIAGRSQTHASYTSEACFFFLEAAGQTPTALTKSFLNQLVEKAEDRAYDKAVADLRDLFGAVSTETYDDDRRSIDESIDRVRQEIDS